MKGLNEVNLIGNIGHSPKIKTFEDGSKKADFSMATQGGYKTKEGEWVDTTEWHNIFATGKTAEIIEKHFTRGMRLMVKGGLRTRSWENKEGKKRYKTEIYMQDFMFLSSKKEESDTPTSEAETNTPEADDDLPF